MMGMGLVVRLMPMRMNVEMRHDESLSREVSAGEIRDSSRIGATGMFRSNKKTLTSKMSNSWRQLSRDFPNDF
jgi:hypothetical protein